jgi:hypothetical protein
MKRQIIMQRRGAGEGRKDTLYLSVPILVKPMGVSSEPSNLPPKTVLKIAWALPDVELIGCSDTSIEGAWNRFLRCEIWALK